MVEHCGEVQRHSGSEEGHLVLNERPSKGQPGLQLDPCCPASVEAAPVVHLGGFGAGEAIPAARRVLFLAVRTARHRGRATVEDRLEVTTLRAGRVRAAMLCICMDERAEGTDGKCAGTAVGDVTELTAFPTLGVFGGGEHLLHSPVSREEVERGEKGESVWWGHKKQPRRFLFFDHQMPGPG